MDDVGMQPTTDARPIHRVYVDGFWMDATEVTNAQFAKFVKATGYVTSPSGRRRAEDFPARRRRTSSPGSVVFTPPDQPVPLDDSLPVVALRRGRELAASGRARQQRPEA